MHPAYLDEIYETSGAREMRQKIQKDMRFTYYDTPSLFLHAVLSPIHLCHVYNLEERFKDGHRPVVTAMKEVVEPYVMTVLDSWIK